MSLGMNLPTTILSGQKLVEADSINEAKAYAIGMNSTVPIFDKNEDVFYLKQTDAYGNVVSFRKFRYTEEIEKAPLDDRYATVEQFNQFKEEVLNGQRSIQQSIDRLSAANTRPAKPNRTDNAVDKQHDGNAKTVQ